MANIFKTSIGKKLIMSISGGFLILFMLLHMTINSFSLFDTLFGRWGAYDGWFRLGCDFMSLPVVNVMVPVLAFGFIIHIVYGLILSISNFRARGGFNRYEVDSKAKNDSFAAKNMIYLGLIVLGFIALHLTHFWQDMQLQEWTGGEAEDPYFLLERTFGNFWVLVLYILWFIVLYLHIGHGFWSAFQTLGWNNMTWLPRLKWIGRIVGIIICLGLTAVAVCAFCHANGLFGLTSVTSL
ncbi:MAG: succinate dehydrogenase cytochrome b subunit [Bacteroidales bacterium]|nr:succinate dehydrogenase cytochrome b subunit [Bacteroidales bacterium]